MTFTRCRNKNVCSNMVLKRQGGRVSLFNYNPSIAGGKLACLRYPNAHRRGSYLLGKTHDAMPAVAKINGEHKSGHAGVHHSVHHGMAAPMATAKHERLASRKRILDSIAEHMSKKRR